MNQYEIDKAHSNPDIIPEHNKFSEAVWDTTKNKWQIKLNKEGQKLIIDYLKVYPNPAKMLFTAKNINGARSLATRWLFPINSERAEQANTAAKAGLVHAAFKFKDENIALFSTYATYWIYNYVGELERLKYNKPIINNFKKYRFNKENFLINYLQSKIDDSKKTDTDENIKTKEKLLRLIYKDNQNKYLLSQELTYFINKLPEKDKNILIGIYYENNGNMNEYAKSVGKSREWARLYRNKALEKLREIYNVD